MASNDQSSESSRKCSRSFILRFLQALFVCCFIIGVLWLSVAPNPKHPVYEVADVYISPVFQNAGNSASLKQISDVTQNTTSNVTTTIILRLEISNHNRVIGIVYDETYMALYNAGMGVGFGAGTLPGFYQGRGNSTTRELRVDVNQKLYLRGIQGRRFNMQICLKTKVQYRILDSKTKHHQLSYQALIPIGEDGRIVGVDNKLHNEKHPGSCFNQM